jgi:hypothetical protein
MLHTDALDVWRQCDHPLARVAVAFSERDVQRLKVLEEGARSHAVLTNDWETLGGLSLHFDAGTAALHCEKDDEAIRFFSLGATKGDEQCFRALLSIDAKLSTDESRLLTFSKVQGALVALGMMFERSGDKKCLEWYEKADILAGGPHLVRLGKMIEEEHDREVEELRSDLLDCD